MIRTADLTSVVAYVGAWVALGLVPWIGWRRR